MDVPLVLMRVANHLEHTFVPHLDCSDLPGRDGDEATKRSRALAAFCVSSLTGVDEIEAAKCVVDGYGDQGIDAVFFHNEANRLYIVQSKWRQNGRSSVGTDDCSKFLRGVRLLVAADFASFNSKLQPRSAEITDALSRSDVEVILVLACSSQPDLPADTKSDIDAFLAFQNGAIDVDIFKFEWFNLSRVYASISSQSHIGHIRFQIGLSQWGTIIPRLVDQNLCRRRPRSRGRSLLSADQGWTGHD